MKRCPHTTVECAGPRLDLHLPREEVFCLARGPHLGRRHVKWRPTRPSVLAGCLVERPPCLSHTTGPQNASQWRPAGIRSGWERMKVYFPVLHLTISLIYSRLQSSNHPGAASPISQYQPPYSPMVLDGDSTSSTPVCTPILQQVRRDIEVEFLLVQHHSSQDQSLHVPVPHGRPSRPSQTFKILEVGSAAAPSIDERWPTAPYNRLHVAIPLYPCI